jgi:hypothetical protein
LNDGLGGKPSNSGVGFLNLGLWRSLSSLAARGGGGGGGIKEVTTAGGGGVIGLGTGAGGSNGCCASGITVGSGTGGSSGDFTLLGASEGF